jgi:hypothetical protein
MSEPQERSIEELEALKVAERLRILQLPPNIAQAEVNQILCAESWTVDLQVPWEDSLPSTEDELAYLAEFADETDS